MLFSRKAKKTRTDQSILQAFLLCLKRNVYKHLKLAAAKKSFPSVYIINKTCFDECFLVHVFLVHNWKTLFFNKFSVTQRFGAIAMFLNALQQVLWKRSAFYVCYLHNNTSMLLIPKVSKKIFIDSVFLHNIFLYTLNSLEVLFLLRTVMRFLWRVIIFL